MPKTNLARLRKQACLKQKELADASGVHIVAISRLETGKRDIGGVTLRSAARIAEALGVHAEELLDKNF